MGITVLLLITQCVAYWDTHDASGFELIPDGIPFTVEVNTGEWDTLTDDQVLQEYTVEVLPHVTERYGWSTTAHVEEWRNYIAHMERTGWIDARQALYLWNCVPGTILQAGEMEDSRGNVRALVKVGIVVFLYSQYLVVLEMLH